MKVSQRTEYGIRAMVALAERYEEGPVSIKDIAEREAIPETFLEQIMADLRRAGVIASTRGAYGGYRLAKPPRETSVGLVVATLEGSLSPARCGNSCEKMSDCTTRTVLDRIEESITVTLDNIYLEELMKAGVGE